MAVIEGVNDGGAWIGRVIRLLIALAVVGGAAFFVYWYFFSGSSKTVTTAKPQEATVTRGQLVSTLQTTGTAASTLTTKLGFQGSGTVKALNVKVGDMVKS